MGLISRVSSRTYRMLRKVLRHNAFSTIVTSQGQRKLNLTSSPLAIKPLILSDIGEGTRDVEVISWLIKEGDQLDAWDDVVEVQSDKASVNIQVPNVGKVVKIYWEEGDTVKVGEALCDIDYE